MSSVQSVRAEKQQFVDELHAQFAQSQASFVFEYKGCTCAELSDLRRKLRASGSQLKVVKNTLAKRAAADTGASVLKDFFVGQVAVILAEKDAVSSAKALAGFAKEKDQLNIKGGCVDGQLVNAKDIAALASLPSREQLIGKLLGLLNAPATRLLQTMNAPASNLARLLEAWRSKQEKSGS